MKNERKREERFDTMSHTLDLHSAEAARKAVGSLFDEEEEPIVSGYESAVKPYFKEADSETEYERYDKHEDKEAYYDDYEEEPPAPRKREPLPAPKPAVKVNPTPAARKPRPAAKEETPPRRPAHKYVFVEDEEDEYTMFRPRSRQRGEEVLRPVRGGRVERTERSGVAERAERSERTERPERPVRRPAAERVRENWGEPYEEQSITTPVRIVAMGLAFLFLVLMAFLVWQNNSLRGQLYTANESLAEMPGLRNELSSVRLERDYYRSQLSIMQQPVLPPPVDTTPPAAEDPPANNLPEENVTAAPAEPDPPTAITLPATHEVVRNNTLSGLAQLYYGADTLENRNFIAEANNLVYPFVIHIGDMLTIPALP